MPQIHVRPGYWIKQLPLFSAVVTRNPWLLAIYGTIACVIVIVAILRFRRAQKIRRVSSQMLEEVDYSSLEKSSTELFDSQYKPFSSNTTNSGTLAAKADEEEALQDHCHYQQQQGGSPPIWRRHSYPFTIDDYDSTQGGDPDISTPLVLRDTIEIFPDDSATGFWRRRVLEFQSPAVVDLPGEASEEVHP